VHFDLSLDGELLSGPGEVGMVGPAVVVVEYHQLDLPTGDLAIDLLNREDYLIWLELDRPI